MRISDWSSDVCSADLRDAAVGRDEGEIATRRIEAADGDRRALGAKAEGRLDIAKGYGAARRDISEIAERQIARGDAAAGGQGRLAGGAGIARRDVAARGGDGQLLSRRDRLRPNRASFDRGAVRRGGGSGKGGRPAGSRDAVAAR